jgi:hypothetical protein
MQQQSLEFHIEQNDYFGTLATVLDLMRQDLARKGYPRHSATLANVCQELMELHHGYRLERRLILAADIS